MAVTLSESKLNAQEDYDPAVIDEFRKTNGALDSLVFDDAVSPTGGGTLIYGYRRLITQPTAATRAYNTEYTPQNVTTEPKQVELAVMGGSFEVDRVLAKLGPAASSNVSLNITQKVKAASAKFNDELINGDTRIDANGFDGLDKALTGSDTEFKGDVVTNWTDLDTDPRAAFKALDLLDEWLSNLDGTPTVILGNTKALARVRAIARRSGQYVKDPIDGLVGAGGRPIERETYGGILLVDAGAKAGSNDAVIDIRKQGNVTAEVTAVSGDISFKVNGVLVKVAFNASAATLQAALDAVVPGATVTKSSSTFTILYAPSVHVVFSDADGVTIADAGTTNAPATGITDLYAYRVGLDAFHGVSTVGGQLVQTWLPDFSSAGAVKKGEVELGPVGVALKATKAASVFRNIKVQ